MSKKKIAAVIFTIALLAVLTLSACQMAVDEDTRNIALMEPYISKQPSGFSYFTDEYTAPPELSIEIKDWASKDGSLTYQWYTFEDLDDFILNGEGCEDHKIQGASGTSYTPDAADLKTSAGDVNYFYIIVTNTNSSAIDRTTGSIRSEIAIISFSAPGGAIAPVITRHPANTATQIGRALNALNIRAALPEGKTGLLSYQWYTVELAENEGVMEIAGKTEIPGATFATFQPDPVALNFGKNYFYAVVTNTDEGSIVTQASSPAIIEITAGARAAEPRIEVQPKDRLYFIGETVGNLSVQAVSRDYGDITYQWYSNPSNVITASSGTAISGANGKNFLPPVNTGAADVKYYYVVVTNTNDYAEVKTASVTSKVTRVSVAASGSKTENATVTVKDPKVTDNRYQYVRGYGGMDVAWNNFPEQTKSDMETMHNPDTGLGFNISRIMIMPWNVNIDKMMNDVVGGDRPDFYENVKVVNKYGGYVLASPWSPPKEWKSNNSINGGGHLIYGYYKQYASYLRAFAQHMYDKGAPIYAVSISNEPNYVAGYDGCEWEPEQMRDFFRMVGRFTNGVKGYGGGKQIPVVLTVNGESANTPDINLAALNDSGPGGARQYIDLYARHVYGSQTISLWRLPNEANSVLKKPDGTRYEVWMTEHNINSANATAYPNDSTWNYVWRFLNDVDLVMRMNNENAFVWWASKRFYSMLGDDQFGTADGVPTPRGWGLSHYAKYTIDTHRINIDIEGTLGGGSTPVTLEESSSNINSRTFSLDNTSARITAYASIESGKNNAPINNAADDVNFISLVMWTPTNPNGSGGINMGTVKIDMPEGFLIGSAVAIKSTSATNVHAPYEVTIAADRKSAWVELNRSEILSVKFTKQ